jgi:S-adenosyl-L-methionine hydrolase (adenosine-forming)
MKTRSPIITLTTDFGASDWFVGSVKGVILSINPHAQIIDISHQIAPGDIASGAFILANACSFFPPGAIHVAVVDPGVGSQRAALIVQTRIGFFVGPDNGLFSIVLEQHPPLQVRRLMNPRFFRASVSATFHGRDVFAPAAAHLSRGTALSAFGPRQADYCRLPRAVIVTEPGILTGEISYVDRFGNAITNIPGSSMSPTGRPRLRVKRRSLRLVTHYQAGPPGQPIALVGSHGYIEIAVNGGSAARLLRLNPGMSVKLTY